MSNNRNNHLAYNLESAMRTFRSTIQYNSIINNFIQDSIHVQIMVIGRHLRLSGFLRLQDSTNGALTPLDWKAFYYNRLYLLR